MMRRLLQAVTTWEWLLLLLLLPLLFFNTTAGALSLLVVVLFWLIRKISTGHFFPRTPFNITLLILALALLISFSAVFDIALSLPKISGVVLGFALYFAAVEHCRQRENGLWNIVVVVILTGTAVALVAIPFSRWPAPVGFLNQAADLLPQGATKLPGTVNGIINPNELAGVLAWIVPLLAAITFGYRRPLWRSERWYAKIALVILAACLTITISVLLVSGSRGGIGSVILAILVMLAVEFSWGRWLLLAGLVGTIIFIFLIGPEQMLASPSDAAESLGLQARVEIWSRGIYALQEFPLTGLSMNGFRKLVYSFYPLTLVPPATDIGHAHNHLLQAGLDLGIVGLIAYLAIWFLSAGLLWSEIRDETAIQVGYRPLLIGLAGSLTAGWIFGILDAIALGAKPGFIWWLLIALVAASTSALHKAAAPKEEMYSAV